MSVFLVLISAFMHFSNQKMAQYIHNAYADRMNATQLLNSSHVISKEIAQIDQTLLLAPLNQAERNLLLARNQEKFNMLEQLLQEYELLQTEERTTRWMVELRKEKSEFQISANRAMQLLEQDFSQQPYQYYMNTAVIHRDNMDVLLRVMIEHSSELAEQQSILGVKLSDTFVVVTTVLSLLTILLASYLGWMMNRLITTPLNGILIEMEAVARGDMSGLSHYVPIDSQDELGKLSQAFDRMARSLQNHLNELAENSRNIFRVAYQDFLTELPNRRQFMDRMRELLVESSKAHGRFIVIFIDLNRFKDVNDSYGHSVGDRLLLMVAQRLRQTMPEADILARLGGDEFTMIFTGVLDIESINDIARRIVAVFSPPYQIGDHTFYCSASMGIAIYPDHGTESEALLRAADTAMFAIKKQTDSNYQIYNETMHAGLLNKMKIERCLHQAMGSDEFELYFQPKIEIVSGRLTSVEALLRWHSLELGDVEPSRFIPIAEDTRLIIPLGEWILKEACQWISLWKRKGLQPVRVAINLSPWQFHQNNLAMNILSLFEQERIEPHEFEIEITEGVLMDTNAEHLANIECLRQKGVVISVDDFGTGYSSLEYLQRFPVDCLKIDRSFIQAIGGTASKGIAHLLIKLAHGMGLKVVAEGVETKEQLEYLRIHRCDEAQGYYLYKPMSAKELEKLLISRNTTGFSQ
jgi:diguanylate cyclase (GGDEF)-like protein